MIFMIDGKIRHGGLADRLAGIMNIYAICKIKNISFKLYWIFPFEIHNFLVPNRYDWAIKKNEISYSINHSKVIVKIQENTVLKNIRCNKQIHIYCNNKNLDQINNAYRTRFTYHDLFDELFRMSEDIQKKIMTFNNGHSKNQYIGIQFRFMDLLGDFNEGRFSRELPETKKRELLMLCYKVVKYLSRYYNRMVFLSSDSTTFLNYIANKVDNIFFIPGNSTHMDRISNESLAAHEKSFLDFFILAFACKIINICGHGLYNSGFGFFASEIHNGDFVSINLDEDTVDLN
jgi:hypothetical protein